MRLPTLREFFPIAEETGRDLHDRLDVVLDMAQSGLDYERELMRVRKGAVALAATGDVIDPLRLRSGGPEVRDQMRTHRRSGAYAPDIWNFDYPTKRVGRPFDFRSTDKPRFRPSAAGSYRGSERDPAKLIAIWSSEAHMSLDNVIDDDDHGMAAEHRFERVEDAVDKVAELSRKV